MSRHTFPGKGGASEVAIGWDRPLATFFVQVFRPDPLEAGEETAFIWVGTDIGELPTAAAAISIAAPHADLPGTLGATLETDRLKTVAASDGPAQTIIKRLFRDT